MGKTASNNLDFLFPFFMERKLPCYYKSACLNTISLQPISLANFEIVLPPKGKTTLVRNIPEYLSIKPKDQEPNIRFAKISQYQGFLVNLEGIGTIADYLNQQLSTRNRKQLRSKKRKLESQHKITYRIFYGSIEEPLYDKLFQTFYVLLEKRFTNKKTYNKFLVNWDHYHKLAYPMICDKRASLFVIFDDGKPIKLTLNFHLDDVVFSFIEAFDMDYSPYNLGDISMLNHLEWCIAEGVTLFDLSMGDNFNKRKWCNQSYLFHYHIFYDRRSFMSITRYHLEATKLRLKQFLRDRNIAGKLIRADRLLYRLNLKRHDRGK